jgi:polysaccharide biosynthesis transport protein
VSEAVSKRHTPAPFQAFDIALLVRVLRRRWTSVVLGAVLFLALGLTYAFLATPTYMSSARLLVSPPAVKMFDRDSAISEVPVTVTMLESQMEVLRSELIARRIVEKLRLHEDDEFLQPSAMARIQRTITELIDGPQPERSAESRIRAAVSAVRSNIEVKRLAPASVLEVSYQSPYPRKNAAIANEIANAYIVDQIETSAEGATKASGWLRERLDELRRQASEADRAVQDFRLANDMLDASGRLVDDQRVAELNTQLNAAQAQTGEAKARLDRLSQITNGTVPDAAVADVLRNAVITNLRQKYLDSAQREGEIAGRYGPNHEAAAKLRAEMRETQRAIASEVGRIKQTFESDYEIAKGREAFIRNNLTEISQKAGRTRQAQVQLRELESTAQSYRALHDSFQQRYLQAVQQQSSAASVTEARVITAAVPSSNPSWPKTPLIAFAGIMAGTMFGFAFGVFRELTDRLIRTPSDVEEATGAACLGVIPQFEGRPSLVPPQRQKLPIFGGSKLPAPVVDRAGTVPYSRMNQVLRSVKVAADLAGFISDTQVLGVTSSVKGEGKTTISYNLARLLARSGKRTILIDCDLKSPALSRQMDTSGSTGLLGILTGETELDAAIIRDSSTGLDIIPNVARTAFENSDELMISEPMRSLLAELRRRYRYVIVDLPPLTPVVDVRASASLFDRFILVAEWSKTSMDLLQQSLATSPVVQTRLLGTILNKADTAVLRKFEDRTDILHSEDTYRRYGYAY